MDHCEGSDLPARGGKGCPSLCHALPFPVSNQRPKKGRSLHFLPFRAARRATRGRELAVPRIGILLVVYTVWASQPVANGRFVVCLFSAARSAAFLTGLPAFLQILMRRERPWGGEERPFLRLLAKANQARFRRGRSRQPPRHRLRDADPLNPAGPHTAWASPAVCLFIIHTPCLPKESR